MGAPGPGASMHVRYLYQHLHMYAPVYSCIAWENVFVSKTVTARLTHICIYIYIFFFFFFFFLPTLRMLLSIQIDSVGVPSWQAQLSGTKTWTLTPPVECDNVCSSFNVTVHRGDISEHVHILKFRIIIIVLLIIQHNKYVVNLHYPKLQ